jgi:cyclase
MRRVRVIPVLQIENRKLVKTIGFKSPSYVGDPLNALRILNEKQVDEVAVVDIGATQKKKPDMDFIHQLASECFMPMSYGGGISSVDQVREIFQLGIEKIIIGASFYKRPDFVTDISKQFGSQSVMVSVDVKKNWLGIQRVFINHGTIDTGHSPVSYAALAQTAGAGELLLQSIERDGSFKGYDFNLIEKVSKSVTIPVVPLGGANSITDFLKALQVGASAVAAGSMFVFKGPHKAVLINYPDQEALVENFYNRL